MILLPLPLMLLLPLCCWYCCCDGSRCCSRPCIWHNPPGACRLHAQYYPCNALHLQCILAQHGPCGAHCLFRAASSPGTVLAACTASSPDTVLATRTASLPGVIIVSRSASLPGLSLQPSRCHGCSQGPAGRLTQRGQAHGSWTLVRAVDGRVSGCEAASSMAFAAAAWRQDSSMVALSAGSGNSGWRRQHGYQVC